MPVDTSVLKDRTKQILRRIDNGMNLARVAESLGMQLQPTKNLLYRQRTQSGALSVGHLLIEFVAVEESPDEYEETCCVCGQHTGLDNNITRDAETVFCSDTCIEKYIKDFLFSVVLTGSDSVISLDKINFL